MGSLTSPKFNLYDLDLIEIAPRHILKRIPFRPHKKRTFTKITHDRPLSFPGLPVDYTWWGVFMGARRHGHLPPPLKCCKVFLCISRYSKMLSRQIICALFSQPIVGFWGLRSQPPLDPAGALSSSPNLPTLERLKKSCGCPLEYCSVQLMS